MTHSVEAALALLAGLATVASPCVLPVLPILLGVSGERPERGRPLRIVAGFVLSFSGFALALGAASDAAQLAQETLRELALAVLALTGLLRIWPRPWDWLAGRGAMLLARMRGAPAAGSGAARGGAFVLGLSLGAVWTPCAGPVLASIIALVVQARDPGRATLLVLLYAIGAGLPMLGLIYGGGLVTQRVRLLARHAQALQRGFGVLVLASAAAIHFQYDTRFYAWVADAVALPTLKGL